MPISTVVPPAIPESCERKQFTVVDLETERLLSFTLWGGRFNPIVIVDYAEQAKELINAFRADVIFPIGDSEEVKQFPKKFPYLIKPFFHDSVFVGDGQYGSQSQVLDVYNALVHVQRTSEWKTLREHGVCLYSWSEDDPLADIFLLQLGEYPKPDEIKVDYRDLLKNASEAKDVVIEKNANLPADLFEHPSIAFMSRFAMERHHGMSGQWGTTPGFYSGDANNLDDLVCCWNLRAADIPLFFVDTKYLERYAETVAARGEVMRTMVSRRRHEWDRILAVWVREDELDKNKMVQELEKTVEPFKKQGAASTKRSRTQPPTSGRVVTELEEPGAGAGIPNPLQDRWRPLCASSLPPITNEFLIFL